MVRKTMQNIIPFIIYNNRNILVKTFFLIISIIIFSQNIVKSEILPGTITISPQLGKYSFEGNQNIIGGTYYILGVGYDITSNWAVEFSPRLAKFKINYLNPVTKTSYNNDTDSIILQLNTFYYLNNDELIVPYIFGGLGNIYIDTHNSHLGNHTFSFGNYGLGAKYRITDNVSFRTELSHIITFGNSDFNVNYEFNHNLAFTFGLSFSFYTVPKGLKKADSDGDGVPDDLDLCSDSSFGVLVDETGCALDNDSDGIDDYNDKCPQTPEGALVDSRGCPIDSDGDGLFDYEDNCPDTKPNVRVDNQGCAKKYSKTIRLNLNIHFDNNKTNLKPEHYKNLKKLGYLLKKYPDSKAIIESHTDSIGPAGYNLNLSQKRAENIIKYLVTQLNIDSSRLEPVGYGETRPVADDSNEAGRSKNRRIVAVIILQLQ